MPRVSKRAQSLHSSLALVKTQCSFIWQHSSPRICGSFQFPTSSAVTEVMGVLQNVGPREFATDLQSKRNGRVTEQIPARKDFRKSWYLNTQVLHVSLQGSRSMNSQFSLTDWSKARLLMLHFLL